MRTMKSTADRPDPARGAVLRARAALPAARPARPEEARAEAAEGPARPVAYQVTARSRSPQMAQLVSTRGNLVRMRLPPARSAAASTTAGTAAGFKTEADATISLLRPRSKTAPSIGRAMGTTARRHRRTVASTWHRIAAKSRTAGPPTRAWRTSGGLVRARSVRALRTRTTVRRRSRCRAGLARFPCHAMDRRPIATISALATQASNPTHAWPRGGAPRTRGVPDPDPPTGVPSTWHHATTDRSSTQDTGATNPFRSTIVDAFGLRRSFDLRYGLRYDRSSWCMGRRA
jgi:hypothetical protein